ncbi:MAG TPA: HEAT repeat domain-containing protein [Myxococcales bacterium]|nr:HEAT repeat domain-containing protein [Myxococcales bacterium]
METRRLLIQSAITFALVLAPGMGWAGNSKGNPMATVNDRAAPRADRIKAIKALAHSRDPQAIDALIKQLAIMDEGIVAALKDSLRALKAVPVLEQRLGDSGSSEEQKVLACIGLRVLKEKSSIPPLVSALKDQSPHVRKEAALALGVIAPAEAEAALLTALSDSDEDVRYFAADALGDVRTAAVKQAIETRLAVETSPVVRSALLAAKNKLNRDPER